MTERLLLRPMRPDDVDAMHQRRNDSDIAVFQNWTLPYPRERSEEIVAEIVAMDGPTNNERWMLTIADLDDTTVIGDLVVHLTWDGRAAEVGYTLAREYWGKGYAVEALDDLLTWLWTHPELTRASAMLHPSNIASAQVLERTGFIWEGRTRLSFWVGDDNSDDWLYGMTRHDREAWVNRPSTEADHVRLIKITSDNLSEVERIVTHKTQEGFVSPITKTFGDVLFPYEGAPWMRVAEADGLLVGFVLVSWPDDDSPILSRILVDRLQQRRGLGTKMVELVAEECRARGVDHLRVTWIEGRGSPGPFYRECGFVETGREIDGEIEGKLAL